MRTRECRAGNIMENTNQKKENKILVALLAVIAACMVCVVVLLLNANNGSNASWEVNNVVEENVPQENVVEQEMSTASEIESPYYQYDGELSDTPTESPYYQYDGELSDTPITPTEVENVDILDYFYRENSKEQMEKIKIKERMISAIFKAEEQYEVYANPTIIPGCEPVFSHSAILVDIHKKDNTILTLGYNEDEDQIYVIPGNLYEVEPIVQNGIYIFNACNLYAYLKTQGISKEQFNIIQSRLLNDIEGYYRDGKISEATYKSIPYLYATRWEMIDGEFHCSLEFSTENGIHGSFPFIGIELEDESSYESIGTFYDLEKGR